MQTIYLKTTNADALWTALATVNLAEQQLDMDDPSNQRPEDAAEDWQPSGAMKWCLKTGYDLDIIGEIWKPNANNEMEKQEGYHANIRMWNSEFDQNTLSQLPTIETPNNPVRVWA